MDSDLRPNDALKEFQTFYETIFIVYPNAGLDQLTLHTAGDLNYAVNCYRGSVAKSLKIL